MTFPENEQKKHRDSFIADRRKDAWAAACNAEYIETQINELYSQTEKLEAEEKQLEAAIKASDLSFEGHTYEAREKRKEMQQRRNEINKQLEGLGRNIAGAQQQVLQLIQATQANLDLAKFAKDWSWEVVDSKHGD